MRYSIEWREHFLYLWSAGGWDAQAISEIARKVLEDPRWVIDSPILVDHREVDFSQVTPTAVRSSSESFKGMGRYFGKSRCAIVTGSALAYGFARMWNAQTSQYVEMQVRIFADFHEAEKWVVAKEARA